MTLGRTRRAYERLLEQRTAALDRVPRESHEALDLDLDLDLELEMLALAFDIRRSLAGFERRIPASRVATFHAADASMYRRTASGAVVMVDVAGRTRRLHDPAFVDGWIAVGAPVVIMERQVVLHCTAIVTVVRAR